MVLLYAAPLWLTPVWAELPPTPAMVLLRASTIERCASGVMLNSHTILTNTHVVRDFCSQNTCQEVEVATTNALGAVPAPVRATLTVRARYPSLDLAEIELSPPLTEVPTLPFTTPQRDTSNTVYGFPRCDTLRISQGNIGSLSAINFVTSAGTYYGGSGSAVVDQQGSLLGVVTGSKLGSAWLLALFREDKFPALAARIDVWLALRELPAIQRLRAESRLLLELYSSLADIPDDTDRNLRRLDFLMRVKSLFLSAQNEEATRSFALEQRIHSLTQVPLTDIRELAGVESLLYLFHLESYSAIRTTSGNLTVKQIRHSKEMSEPLQLALRHFAVLAGEGDSAVGVEQWVTTRAWIFLGIGTCVALLWFFSVGWVLCATHGSIPRRIGIAILVGVLVWPISVVVWRFVSRARTTP